MDDPRIAYAFEGFRLDMVRHELLRDGEMIALEPKAFAVLSEMVARPGAMLSRDELMDTVWGHRHVTPGVLSRSISQLRKALGDDAVRPRYIKTVHALGYQFIATVEVSEQGPTAALEAIEPIKSEAPSQPGAQDAQDRRRGDRRAKAPAASVAILPFTDLSAAGDQDYFCDGLAEEVINALTRVRGLHVASRTSSFRFRGGTDDVRTIGRCLNVAAIMEGGVRVAGERLRVTAQLINAGNGYHLWSEVFDRRLEDIFTIQEEIANSVVDALCVALKPQDAIQLQRYAPRDMRAHDYYLRGQQEVHRHAWLQAAQMYRRAIELDPGYAQAHAALANALTELIQWRIVRGEDVLGEALAASGRALELAPKFAEAHVAHAQILALAGNNAGAVAAFEHALRLDPQLYEANYWYGNHCFAHGHWERAIELFEAAHNARPFEFNAIQSAASAAYAAGDAPRTRKLATRALAAVQRHLELDPANARTHSVAGVLHQRLGDIDAGRQQIEASLSLEPEGFYPLYNAACFHALVGDNERALDLLEQALAQGEGFLDWIQHDADLNGLRELPRYRVLMARFE